MDQNQPHRGEVRLTGSDRPDGARPRNSFLQLIYDQLGLFLGGAIGLLAIGLVAGLFSLIGSSVGYFENRNDLPRTECEGEIYGVPCLPKAPGRPVRSASFQIQFGPDADSTINFVITDAHISIHVVQTLQTLPPEIALAGVRVTRGVSKHLSSLKSFPPLIFSGSVDMHVGPIQENDHLTTRIRLGEDAIKSIETLYDRGARGRPKENEPRPVLDVYIVGSLLSYEGPNQHGKSIHDAQIIDLGASPEQWKQFNNDVKEWRTQLAKATKFSEQSFKTVFSDADAQDAAFQQHIYEMQNPAYRWRVDHPGESPEEYERRAERFEGIR